MDCDVGQAGEVIKGGSPNPDDRQAVGGAGDGHYAAGASVSCNGDLVSELGLRPGAQLQQQKWQEREMVFLTNMSARQSRTGREPCEPVVTARRGKKAISYRFISISYLSLTAFRGRSLDEPRFIVGAGTWKRVVLVHRHRNFRALVEPLLNLCVSISEAEPTRPSVITGGKIGPASETVHTTDQPAVVDAVGLLIHEHPEHGRDRILDIRHFLIAPPVLIPMRAVSVVVTWIRSSFDKTVHADASDPRHGLTVHFAVVDVTRTFVDTRVFGGIGRDLGSGEVE